MTNLKETITFNDIQEFVYYNAERFLEGKKLRVNDILDFKNLQLAVGIMEDNTQYADDNTDNKGKE